MNEVPYLTHAQGPLAAAIMGMLITTPDARISAEQATGLLSMARSGTGMPTPPGGQPTTQYGGFSPTLVRSAPNIPRPGGPSTVKRKLAISAAAILGVLLLVGGAFLGSWLATPGGYDQMLETYTYGPGGDILDVADGSYPCIDAGIAQGHSITDTQWVECEKQHFAEVYDGVDAIHSEYSDSEAAWANRPDPGDLERFAEARCALTFKSNAVRDDRKDELVFRAVVPSEQVWNERPDEGTETARGIFCVLSRADGGQYTGSDVVKIK